MRAIGAEVQRFASRGDRVAVLAPQGLDYVAGFFAAIKAGTVAVPLFAPELAGHAQRLAIALHDSRPTVVLTTTAASAAVEAALTEIGLAPRPHVIAIDDVPGLGGRRVGVRFTSTRLTSPICSTRRVPPATRSAWKSPTERSAPT